MSAVVYTLFQRIWLPRSPSDTVGCVAALQAQRMVVDQRASDIIERALALWTADRGKEMLLIDLTVSALGFTQPHTEYAAIMHAANLRGLGYCPRIIGPHVRLNYRNQQEGENFRIAMEPIKISCGNYCIYSLTRSEGVLELRGVTGYPESLFKPADVFAFCVL